MLRRLLFISRSRLSADSVPSELRAITATSQARNASLSVTGRLLHTGTHFSQVMEGTAVNVDTLMSVIKSDSRHSDILVLERRCAHDRLFSDWSTVYTGQATYIQRMLDSCLEMPDDQRRLAKLLRLFEEFSTK